MNEELQNYIEQIKLETDIFAKSRLLHDLVYKKSCRIIDLAKLLGKTSSYLCHLLRLVELPDIIIDGYYTKQVSLSHLFIISRIKDKKKLIEVYEKILSNNYTVQQTEETVREILYEIQSSGNRLPKDEIRNIVEKIKQKNEGIDVKIIQTRIKGKVVIDMKGGLENTSSLLREFLAKLTQ